MKTKWFWIGCLCGLLYFFFFLVAIDSSWGQDAAGQYLAADCQTVGLANKVIRLYRANDTTATGLVATDTTDANGRWDVRLPGSGNYITKLPTGQWGERFTWIDPPDLGVDIRYYNNWATDWSAALQKSIDSSLAIRVAGDSVLPYSTTLKLKPGRELKGTGPDYGGLGARLQYNGTSWAVWVDSTQGNVSDIAIKDLTILGTDSATGGIRWGADKVNFAVNRSNMSNVLIRGFGKWNSIGVKLEGVTHSTFTDLFIDEVKGIPLLIQSENTVQPGPLTFKNFTFGSGSSPQCSISVVLNPESASIHTVTFKGGLISSSRFKGMYIKKGSGGNRVSNLRLVGNSLELNVNSGVTALDIEELFASEIKGNNFTANQTNAKAFHFKRLGITEGVSIENNQFSSYNLSGDTLIAIDTAGSVATEILYGTNSLVGVTTFIRDPKNLLRHYVYAVGSLTNDTLKVGAVEATLNNVKAAIHLQANQNVMVNFDKSADDGILTYWHPDSGSGDQNHLFWEIASGKKYFRLDDNLKMDSTLLFASGANLQTDSVLLASAGDSVRVSNTRVTAGSYVLVFPLAAPAGNLYISNRAAGSFTIKSNADETSSIPVVYFITKF